MNAGQQGSQFAGNIFGTQAQMYGTQMANQGSSPFGAILGGVLGAAVPGIGSALGGMFKGGGGGGSSATGSWQGGASNPYIG